MAPEPETLRVASRRCRNGRGQAMVLIAVAFIGLLAAMGLAVDGGNLYLAKIRLSRAVDSAALAGALKLPDCCGTTTATYGTVQAYLDANEPGAYVSAINSPMPGRVDLTGCTNVPTLFLGVIGFSSTTICANALAGYGAIDLCIALDDTGSMDQNEIRDLKHGVRSFTYMMNMNSFPTDPTSAKIGLVPFRGGVFETSSGSLVTDITPLTADREVILRGLNELRGVASDPDHTGATGGGHGGSGTSIGVGIKYCLQELFRAPFARPAGSVEKVMILFTDGNNEENVNGEFCLKDFPCGLGVDAPGASPTRTPVRATNTPNPTRTPTHTPNPTIANTPTRTVTPNPAWTKTPTRTATPSPPSPTPSFGLTPTPMLCTSACLDRESRRWAKAAKDAGVTIFTIGYGATQCGGGSCDVDSDLLKEVASGSDKYYWAQTSAVIGEAFAAIGQRIGHRLLR